MHDTAHALAKTFFRIYGPCSRLGVVELGSEDFNGSLRECLSGPVQKYIGCDLRQGPGVDVVIEKNRRLPFPRGTFDIAVTSSALEHDEFFWQTFLYLCYVVEPDGFIYINVPSNGSVHRYPHDHWRFYPDAGIALQNWGRFNGRKVTLIESFIADRQNDIWNDFVAIFRVGNPATLPDDKVYKHHSCQNIYDGDVVGLLNEQDLTEDQRIVRSMMERSDARA